MDSCVSHFNVSLIVWAKSQDSVHKPPFLKRKESRSGSNQGPSAYQHSALPLGHTGSVVFEAQRKLNIVCSILQGTRPHISIPFCHDSHHWIFAWRFLVVYVTALPEVPCIEQFMFECSRARHPHLSPCFTVRFAFTCIPCFNFHEFMDFLLLFFPVPRSLC